MNWIFAGLLFLSVVFALLTGRTQELTTAALNECGSAVGLCVKLLGITCLWSGIMKVADRSGLAERLSRLLTPLLRRLFPGLPEESPVSKAISMNITANLLGLGNAATPLGLQAMTELEKVNRGGDTANDHMVTFLVLNTASLQLIPTTAAALRLSYGSKAPMEILPAVWLTSAAALAMGLLAVKVYGRLFFPERRSDVPVKKVLRPLHPADGSSGKRHSCSPPHNGSAISSRGRVSSVRTR